MADENTPIEETPEEYMELPYTRMDGSDQVFTFVDLRARERLDKIENDFSAVINDEESSAETTYSSDKINSLNSSLEQSLKKHTDDQRALSKGEIDAINEKIPEQASADNQLADKDFVNSTVATETSHFKGTFETLEELKEVSPVTNNDYGYVVTVDDDGNTLYKRYKYSSKTKEWLWEYDLNNSSFTAEEWAAIKSGITAAKVTEYNHTTIIARQNAFDIETLNGPQSTQGSVYNKIKTALDLRNIPSYWFGTQSEYDELTEVEEGRMYFIQRDEE